VDVGLIDGAVNGAGNRAQGIGGVLRKLQSGYIRSYAVWVLAGAVLMLVTVALAGGGR
jgi:NADH-quinone oxidoreductase subunit L